MLRSTFSNGAAVTSGVLSADASFTLEAPGGDRAVTASVDGSFAGATGPRAPRFDVSVQYDPGVEGERAHEFGLIAAADAAYIAIGGDSYAVSPAVFRRYSRSFRLADLDPARWFIEPANEGTERVAGTETIHISGTANVEELLSDLGEAAGQIGLRAGDVEASQGSFDEATIDLFTDADDRTLTRIELRLSWRGELEGGVPFSAVMDFSLNLAQPNESQSIEAPAQPRPIGALADRLPPELSGLGRVLERRRAG